MTATTTTGTATATTTGTTTGTASGTTTKRLYGHRGARGRCPENTLLSFAAALEDGANALEMDVRRTKDGVVVVFHDDDGARVAGVADRVDAVSYAELCRWDLGRGFLPAAGETTPTSMLGGGDPTRPFAGRGLGPPRLVDVLRAFPGIPLNIDLKTPDPALRQDTLRLVEDAGAVDRVLLTSFWDDVIAAVQATGSRVATGLGPRAVRALRFLPAVAARRLLRRHVERGGTRVQVPPRASGIPLDTPGFVARCHDLGFAVDYWVIDDVAQARHLLSRGADGLMSDFPRRLAPLFAR
jgi:glycerophosphoryl diester phosphodiesterase